MEDKFMKEKDFVKEQKEQKCYVNINAIRDTIFKLFDVEDGDVVAMENKVLEYLIEKEIELKMVEKERDLAMLLVEHQKEILQNLSKK